MKTTTFAWMAAVAATVLGGVEGAGCGSNDSVPPGGIVDASIDAFAGDGGTDAITGAVDGGTDAADGEVDAGTDAGLAVDSGDAGALDASDSRPDVSDADNSGAADVSIVILYDGN